MRTLVLLLILLQDPAPTVEQLIDGLRSPKAEERDRAERALLLREKDAFPALERASRDADPEVSTRAKRLLEAFPRLAALTPNLRKAMPGIHEKLATGGPHAWTEAFLQATEQKRSRARHPGLVRDDLLPLVARALRGAEKSDVAHVCSAVAAWELAPAAPELVRWLDESDWEIRRFVVEAVVACRDPSLAPVLLERIRQDQTSFWGTWVAMLARMGGRDAVPEIAAALLHPHENR